MTTYLIIFIVGGLIGWVLDTTYRTLAARHYTSGTLIPFFSLIYATGAILLYTLFTFFSTSLYTDIIAGTIAAILLELTSGFLALKIFRRRFWDYRNSGFNYYGLIDAEHCFYWLILTALYRIIYPFIF